MLRLRWTRDPDKSKRVLVGGLELAHTDSGSGRPIVFLHGGIGSTYIWRGVIPQLAEVARCVAVDLPGTGDSDRIPAGAPTQYTWPLHVEYLDGFLDRLGITGDLTLVMHGWASIVGLAWARDNEDRVAGLSYMEAVTRPMAWHEVPESFRETLKLVRSDDGASYVMRSDEFFEACLDAQTSYRLSPTVAAEYQRAFGPQGDARRAVYNALKDLPLAGRPRESARLVRRIGDWLKASDIPKLLILGQPGYLVTEFGRRAAENIENQSVVRVSGRHLLPEETPELVGTFLRLWWQDLE